MDSLPCGFVEEFLTPVDEDFQCSICHLPLREPVQTRCGHRFCRQCLEEHLKRQDSDSQPCTCPLDNGELTREKDIFPDKATERKILSFVIKCANEGCQWTGELISKESHLALCPFEVVSCTNENCQVTLLKKDMQEHITSTCEWRIIQCPHCNEPHQEYQRQEHIGECKKLPVECPDNCGAVIPRAEVPAHTDNECPLAIISCPYFQMDCDAKIQRKHLESHLQSATRLHFDLACSKLNDTRKETRELEKQVNNLVQKQTEFDQAQTAVKKEMDELKQENSILTAKVASQEKICDLRNDSTSYVWKVSDCDDLIFSGKCDEVESPHFYTGASGYKLRASIKPKGGKSLKHTYLSVFISIMKGIYDAILPWPFHQTVEFTLIDQQDDPKERQDVSMQFTAGPDEISITRPTAEKSTELSGFSRFISHKNLKTRRYIVDDNLFFRVKIGPPS